VTALAVGSRLAAPSAIRAGPLAYPVLLATVPILDLAADNPGQYRSSDLVIVLGVAALVAGGLVLVVLAALRVRFPPAPVIIVVGDHGSRFADVGFYDHPERVTRAFIRERFGAFGAFYLPSGGASAFHEPVTLVNVLGNVLRYYFGADLPLCPDSLYVSGLELYRFYPVDPSVMDPAARPTPGKELP
jgi:hypothetical protein